MTYHPIEYICLMPQSWGRGQTESEAIRHAITRASRYDAIEVYRVPKGKWEITGLDVEWDKVDTELPCGKVEESAGFFVYEMVKEDLDTLSLGTMLLANTQTMSSSQKRKVADSLGKIHQLQDHLPELLDEAGDW